MTFKWIYVLSLAAATIVPTPSLSQTAEPATPDTSAASTEAPAELPPIVVTGEKVKRTLNRQAKTVVSSPAPQVAPIAEPISADLDAAIVQGVSTSSVVIYTTADIQRQAAKDTFSVFETTPNAAVSRDQRDIVIRGVPKDGFAANQDVLTLSQNDLITTYLDGVPISTWAGATSLWDIQQVEIFRGVQTTNFGRGALAGAVVIKSADPTYKFEAAGQASYATFDTYSVSAIMNAPIVAGQSAVRISVDQSGTDGFIDNITAGVKENPDDHLTLRAKALLEPDDATKAIVSYTHSEREKGGGFVDLSLFPGRYANDADVPERINKTVDAASVSITHALSNTLSLEGLSALGVEDAARTLDGDGSALSLIAARVDEDLAQASQEAKLVWNDPTLPFRGFAGAYYRYFDREARNNIDATGLGLPFSALFTSDRTVVTTTNSYALFGEAELDLTKRFRLTAGGRFDHEKADFEFVNSLAGTEDRAGRTDSVFLPKFAAEFDIGPTATISGTVQRGYRAGGAGQSLLTATRYAFDPEFTWNYEIALRATALNNRLSFNSNVFYVDWNDQQVEALTGSPFGGFDTTIVNAGKSEQYGAEAELSYQASKELRLFTNVGLLHTEFVEYETAGSNFSGNEFPFAPRYTIGAGAQYNHQSGFFAAASVIWKDDYFSNAENFERDVIEAHAVVNAQVGYTWQQITASVFARNLFDKEYLYAKTDTFGGGRAGAAAEPQVIGVSLKATY